MIGMIVLISVVILALFWIGIIVGVGMGEEKEYRRLHEYTERGRLYYQRANQHLQVAQGLYKETSRLCRLSWSFLQDSRSNPNNRPDWNKELDELPGGLDKNDL